MLKSRFGIWLIEKLNQSDIAVLKKIGKSLERDQDYSISYLVRKSLIFIRSMAFARLNLRKCDAVGRRARTRRKPNIENSGRIEIGDDVNINSRNVQTDLVTGPEGLIKIGNGVSINFGVSIVAHKRVSVGNRTRVGPYTMIYDSNFHIQGNRYSWAEGDPVIIEDDVWLASRVLVLKGSLIGRGSVVAAGSVVSGIIPPYVVAGGVPARIIKFLKVPDNGFGFQWELSDSTKAYSDDTRGRVDQVFQHLFSDQYIGLPDKKCTPGTVKNWDSVAQVRLIRLLEQEFGITFRREDWPRLSSREKICKVIQSYLNQAINPTYKQAKRV